MKEVRSNLGVCDDYMFKTSISVLNRFAKSGKPFFATFLTASNHQPYIIPDYFKPRATETIDQIIEYTDWSLQQFFNWASKQSWYNNTLFVITGDHGSSIGDRLYDVSLAYHQVPLIFFSPSDQTARVEDRLGAQIDIFPTIMGRLGLGYTNLTFGVDLFKEKRPYVFFSSDNSLECVDDEFFYVKRLGGEESLYRYVDKDPKDYKADYPDRVDRMKEYAESMIQSAQYIVKNSKVKAN